MPLPGTRDPVDALAEFGSPEFLRDPYPFVEWLRVNDPVHLTSKGFYLVSRHADLCHLLSGTTDLLRTPDAATFAESMPAVNQHRSLRTLLSSILSMNPPEHTRVRRLVARVFNRRTTENLAGRIGELCDRLLDPLTGPLHDGQVVDLYPTLCQPLPRLVIADMLGVPEADHDWLTKATIDIAAGLTADSHRDAESMLALADEQTLRLEQYFRALAEERRRNPGDDLLSQLTAKHEEEPERLTEDELVNLVWFLWLAGTDSTAVGLIHCVWTMTEFPDQRHWLEGGYASAFAYVDEVLRRTTSAPYTVTPRLATRDITLNGITYPAGSDFRALFAAANRDPAVFPDPDRFDPSRDNRQTLTFSKGIHHCLGAFLTRTTLTMAVSRLHATFPNLVALNEPHWGGLVRDPALHSLPVEAR
ncbi:cytochrome P450 [Kutzneria sp. CA-103260]|uniref:cytochrome P450 n=1 Tax=Kutzneria sp. CA-103260 TaxID=2802641 RepID=UPI001BA4DDE4|nr:cytochrome P450 [Kutzneria sp. CA-103260]QUQ65531.1 cytochrome P450 [Kutzneria sp. CA-103260]